MNTNTQHIRIALLMMRLSLVALLVIWGVDKILRPDHTAAVFGKFYFIENLDMTVSYVLGVLQLALCAFIAVGFMRTYTYALGAVIQALGTLSTIPQLLAPFDGGNILFWAGIPAMFCFVALFMMREHDTMFTLR